MTTFIGGVGLRIRRVRSGRYEWLCPADRRFYWRLASHLHRFHHAGGHVHGCSYCRKCSGCPK